jgi:peptide/nickel transport system permease protein
MLGKGRKSFLSSVASPSLSLPTGRTKGGLLPKIIRSKSSKFGSAIIIVIFGFILLGPFFITTSPTKIAGPPNSPPSLAHPFGTDYAGHDVMSQVVFGAYPTLIWGIVAAIGATILGFVAGLFGGYYKRLEPIISSATDVVLSFPSLVLLITVGAIFQATDELIAVILILILWATEARAIRAQVSSVKNFVYVNAARTSGLSDWQIVWRIIAPEIGAIAIAYFVLIVSVSIVLAAGVEFLGVGNLYEVSWGTMLYYAQQYGFFAGDWWWVLAPGLLLGLTATGFALIGFSFEEILNPRLRQ